MSDFKTTSCERCRAKCKIDPKPQSKAKLLKRGSKAKGLCVNCAVHDWFRNTYPVNLMFTTLNPKVLRLEHMQEQFAGIMKAGNADANPDEIDWLEIIWNWDLPFKDKVKATATNPASQTVLDMEPEMQARQEDFFREEMIAIKEGFGSLREKEEAEQDRIIKEELLPLLRKRKEQEKPE